MSMRDILLIVDDHRSNRTILRRIFEDSYKLLEAENGEQALLLLEQHRPSIAAMLLDIIMPVMDGYEVLERMKERGYLRDVPVVVVSSMDSIEHEVRVFDLGASDIIINPYEPLVVRHRVQNVVELNRHKWNLQDLVAEQALALRQSHQVMVDALTSLVEYRSLESGQHISRIRFFTKVLLEAVAEAHPEYGLNSHAIDVISQASALHDIGKISIPDAILNKPGPLTPEEFDIMKTHAPVGCEMLDLLEPMGNPEYLRYAYNICRYHHERWDGQGYPDGLKGDDIPICAQVVGIADAYDALTTRRVYKDALPHSKSMEMILTGKCGAFSPRLLACFERVGGEFALLAEYYRDGQASIPLQEPPQQAASPLPQTEAPAPKVNKALRLAERKYLTLLHYMEDVTVMEADPHRGSLRVVHEGSPDFAVLHESDNFNTVIQSLISRAVHPDDRLVVSRLLPIYIQDVLSGALWNRTLRYRVCNEQTGAVKWYDASIMRADPGTPSCSELLFLWKEADGPAYPLTDGQCEFINYLRHGALCCRNDLYFTLESGVEEVLSPLCGFSPVEISHTFHNHYLELIVPGDRSLVHRQLAAQLAQGNEVDLKYRILHRDGHSLWVHQLSTLFSDHMGEDHLVLSLTPLDSFKLAKESIQQSAERDRSVGH